MTTEDTAGATPVDRYGNSILPDEPILEVQEIVSQVLGELPAIAKTGVAPASMGGYAFRRVEDVTAALKPLFAKHRLLCLPTVLQRVETERTTANNKILYVVDLEIAFRFVGPGGDELVATVWGEGSDSGDKAVAKAVTSAFKTMLSVVFCISDSELDAEAHDVPETQRAPAAPERPPPADKERIAHLVDEVGDLNLGDWVRDQGFLWPWTAQACDAISEKIGLTRAKPPETPPASPATPPEAADPASPPCETDAAEKATQPSLAAAAGPEPGDEDWIDPAVLVAQQVEAMPSSAVFAELEAAGLATTGAPKALKKRLTAHRIVTEGAQSSPVY